MRALSLLFVMISNDLSDALENLMFDDIKNH